MRLPTFKRLLSSDFAKESKKLVDQLSLSLNNGIDVLYTVLNNGVSLRDNINCTVRDVLVIVDSSGKPTQDASFQLNNTNKVDGVTVLMAINQVNTSSYPVSGVFISGTQGQKFYTIQNVTGLQANEQYLLRVVAWQV